MSIATLDALAPAPPSAAQPGETFFLPFAFYDYEGGFLTDPTTLQLDITFGQEAPLVPDIAGPFTYSGAAQAQPDTIWRIGTGLYAFQWDIPPSGLQSGVYVATWTATHGTTGDTFTGYDNFPIVGGATLLYPSGDTGYWTGSLSYQPWWAPSPFTITFGAVDENGIAWTLEKVKGWDGAPSVGSVIQRSADHGGWPAAQFLGPRIVTLTLMASAPSQPLRDTARAVLNQAVAIGTTPSDLTTFTYDEPVPKQAQCRLNGSASIGETYPTLCDVVFTIPLVCPDPRKYSPSQQTVQAILPAPVINPLALPFATPVYFPGAIPAQDSAVSVLNAGTFETRPQITVTGPIVSPAVVNGTYGQSISFSGLTMAATDVLTIDLDTRQSFLNAAFYPADPFSQWWVAWPGLNQIYLGGVTTGGASLTVAWSSAWI